MREAVFLYFKAISRRRLMLAALALLALCALLLVPFLLGRTADAFAPAPETRALPVVMYHSLLRDPARWGDYVVSPAQLERDLAYLQEQGYVFVTMAEVIGFVSGAGTLPEKPALLTLDDGYLNNRVYLPEILARRDAHAVIAAVGEYADLFTAREDHNPSYAHMTWAELRDFAAEGRVELGCHSYYFHHQGARLGASRRRGESRGAWLEALCGDARAMRDRLTTQCGVTPRVYVYPYGQISDGADAALRALGFEATLSCYERVTVLRRGDPDCLYSIGRYNRPAGPSSEEFFRRILRACAAAE